MTSPHDHPTSAELVDAVREWLETDVFDAVDGRLQFHTRVAINILAMVQREIESGSRHEADHLERLSRLGYSSDADLAASIREGRHDHELGSLLAQLRGAVHDKLSVANPKYME